MMQNLSEEMSLTVEAATRLQAKCGTNIEVEAVRELDFINSSPSLTCAGDAPR